MNTCLVNDCKYYLWCRLQHDRVVRGDKFFMVNSHNQLRDSYTSKKLLMRHAKFAFSRIQMIKSG